MKKRSDLQKLLEFAGKYRILTYLSWVLSAVSALLALAPFLFIWRMIREVLAVAPNYGAAVQLARNGWMAMLFALLSMLVYLCGLLCSHLAAFRVQANIRSRALHHIIRLPMGFMDGVGSGKLRKTVDESSAATESYLAHMLPDSAGAYATPVGLLALLLIFDWRLGLLSLVPVAAAFAIMSTMTGKRMQEDMRQYQNALDTMSNEAVEYVRGIPVVKTFGQSVFSFKRFKAAIDDYSRWAISYTKEMRRPMICYTTIINAVFAVLIAAALVFTAHGVTNEFLLNLLFYIIITPVITVTLSKVMYASENQLIVADAMKRIESIFAMEPAAEPQTPQHPRDDSVTLRGVSFTYPGAQEKALDGINLSLRPGAHIALVGASGGGKTTLASLVARFWDVSEGEVLIGGVNVKNIAKTELMNTVAFVFQDSSLLKASVFENVRMARPTATREEVQKALHDAQCDDILEKLPEGMDTVIGAKGVYLSGGEQQRISIARVMLKNAPVLILDEATAFADPDNEAKVQQAFSILSAGKTVIMIAHRLSTVTGCDCIYVMKDGRVIEQGTHAALAAQNGSYAHMWKEYGKAANWKVGVLHD